MSDQNNTAKSSHALGSAERVAIITGGFVVIAALITSFTSLKKADTAETVAAQAVALASSKGECSDGGEFTQTFFDRPIEVAGAGGEIDLRTPETSVRGMPKEVPPEAKFVQVLATVNTGNAQESGDDRFLKVTSKPKNSSKSCSFYLYFRTSKADSFAYNSGGEWLPIAADRNLSAAMISMGGTPANPLPGNASATARLFVTGYR